ncbi:SRPBCC domain-containing protein [Kribbella sp. NPDC004875]|uniref:SRPBCC family protein n=1 Tax=Kribbella sp. NPDC004875 TaxID=3364107 RepID=UPI0036B7BFF7
MPQVTRRITIPRTPSVVWQQFVSEDALRRWIAPTLTIELREGGPYRMLGADGVTWISGVVLELVPEGRLVLSWMEEDAGWEHPGRLVITLQAASDGTEVTLTHDGFAGIGTPTWQRTRDAYERGSDRHQVLQCLADAVTGVG